MYREEERHPSPHLYPSLSPSHSPSSSPSYQLPPEHNSDYAFYYNTVNRGEEQWEEVREREKQIERERLEAARKEGFSKYPPPTPAAVKAPKPSWYQKQAVGKTLGMLSLFCLLKKRNIHCLCRKVILWSWRIFLFQLYC